MYKPIPKSEPSPHFGIAECGEGTDDGRDRKREHQRWSRSRTRSVSRRSRADGATIPALMIAPIPSRVMLIGPSVRLSLWPSSCAEARMSSRFLVRKIPRSKVTVSSKHELDAELSNVVAEHSKAMGKEPRAKGEER